MEKKSNIIFKLSYLYIAIPFGIFTIGYMKLPIAVGVLAIMGISMYFMFKNAPKVMAPDFRSKKTVFTVGTVIVLICVWVYLSGIGGQVYQNSDHLWRNAIFEELVNRSWPVTTENSYYGGTVSLIYYIGFWLPAAVMGKIFGLSFGYIFQMVWAAIGILLVYFLMGAINKKYTLFPLILLIFFSGLDIAEMYTTTLNPTTLNFTLHIERALIPFQFSSNTTQLFWVFNQALPVWLITLLLYMQKSNKGLIFIISFALLTSTLPFIGMLPFLALFAFGRKYPDAKGFKEKFIALCKDSLTFENVIGGGTVGILSFLYLVSNIAAENKGSTSKEYNTFEDMIVDYIIFILFEFLVYFAAMGKFNFKRPVFWVSLCILLVCPFITVGNSMDFCWRASIPALFILMIMILETFKESKIQKKRLTPFILSVLLLIGAVTPICEFGRTIKYTRIANNQGIDPALGSFNLMVNDDIDNFVGMTDDSVFFKYIAK